jgi:uncharacterized protein (TIGR02145 family)
LSEPEFSEFTGFTECRGKACPCPKICISQKFPFNLNHRRKTMRKIITKAIALLIAFSTVTLAQEKGSFTDTRDKKKYKTVKIGEQVWMAENLNYADKDSYCYDNKPANCTKYGRLYNWKTAMKACPAGWHLPRNAELEKLLLFVDSTGKETGKHLKAQSGWSDNGGGNGTDKFGFSALPSASGRNVREVSFYGVGEYGNVWSGTSYDENKVAALSISKNAGLSNASSQTNDLFSVRCIQGDEAEGVKAEAEAKAEVEAKAAKEKAEAEAYVKANGETFTDTRDKKTYKTIKINGQTWLAENLNYAAENSKCSADKPENCTKYGRLYNWETAMKSCPAGWHLPKNAEWDKLYRSADGTSGTQSPYSSQTAGKFLKATNGWADNRGTSGNGTDKFGFSALPGGAYLYDDLDDAGTTGFWWSASEDEHRAYARFMDSKKESAVYNSYDKKSALFSVRCIKD